MENWWLGVKEKGGHGYKTPARRILVIELFCIFTGVVVMSLQWWNCIQYNTTHKHTHPTTSACKTGEMWITLATVSMSISWLCYGKRAYNWGKLGVLLCFPGPASFPFWASRSPSVGGFWFLWFLLALHIHRCSSKQSVKKTHLRI